MDFTLLKGALYNSSFSKSGMKVFNPTSEFLFGDFFQISGTHFTLSILTPQNWRHFEDPIPVMQVHSPFQLEGPSWSLG